MRLDEAFDSAVSDQPFYYFNPVRFIVQFHNVTHVSVISENRTISLS